MEPMLAQPLLVEDISRKASGYWMEPKLDGIRCLADDTGRMWSRSAKTDLGPRLPHLANAVRCLNLPQGVVLDGEVGYVQHYFHPRVPDGCATTSWPLLDFNATVRVTGSQPNEALRKQQENYDTMGHLYYFVFDVIDRRGESSTQSLRTADIFRYVKGPQEDGLWVIHAVGSTLPWDERVYDRYVMAGGEGVMLKNPEARYLSGKRPARTWYKIKKFDSADGQIVGFDPGQGKYEGQIGALQVRLRDGITVRCSGFDDALRKGMSDNFGAFKGRWVEVKHYGRVGQGGEGSYRHPQFLRFRPDLDPV